MYLVEKVSKGSTLWEVVGEFESLREAEAEAERLCGGKNVVSAPRDLPNRPGLLARGYWGIKGKDGWICRISVKPEDATVADVILPLIFGGSGSGNA